MAKKMEKSFHIKQIPSVFAKKKTIVWMLYENEPDVSVTGGIMSMRNFDEETNDLIQEKVMEYLNRQETKEASMKEMIRVVK